MKTEAQKRARNKWDAGNMKLVGVKMRRDLAEEFEACCNRNGTNRNAVLLAYVREYVARYSGDSGGTEEQQPDKI